MVEPTGGTGKAKYFARLAAGPVKGVMEGAMSQTVGRRGSLYYCSSARSPQLHMRVTKFYGRIVEQA